MPRGAQIGVQLRQARLAQMMAGMQGLPTEGRLKVARRDAQGPGRLRKLHAMRQGVQEQADGPVGQSA